MYVLGSQPFQTDLVILLDFSLETCSWKFNDDTNCKRLSTCSTPKTKTFTPLPVMCSFQLPSQYHEHSMVLLLFPLRICASGWRGWTLLRASRSVFWRSLDPSVWWELHTPHCPGHLCRAGLWQGCVCPGTWALQRVQCPGLGWRVQVWGRGAWALGLA